MAASRLSRLCLMALVTLMPVKRGMLAPMLNEVLLVFVLVYVFCEVSPRPNEKFCPTVASTPGSMLFLSVDSCISRCFRALSFSRMLMLCATA